jgi:hypothetical protein
MSSLSTFNGWGSTMGGELPYGQADQMQGSPTDYNGSVQAAWYSYQDGIAGYGDPYYGAYGANVFQRIFQPRKWEAEKREEAGGEGFEEGSAQLFSRGTSKKERKDKRALRKFTRTAKKSAKKQARKAKQYRVVRGKGGYVYKQDGNNCYTILKSPRKSIVDKKICPGDPYYKAINAEVLADHGPFSPGASADDWAQLLGVSGQVGMDVLSIFKGKDDFGPGGAPQQAMSTGGGFDLKKSPILWIGGGVLALVLVTTLLKK